MTLTMENKTVVCPHFGACGGCSRQDLSYTNQLSRKEKMVVDYLSGLSVQQFHPIIPSPDTYFYRNKMEFSFGDERDLEILGQSGIDKKTHIGLHPKGRFALVTPTPECLLLSEESQRICDVVAEWANDFRLPIYVRKNNEGDLRHLVIREGKNTGERMVNLVSKSTTTNVDDLANRLKNSGLRIDTFLWTIYDGLSDIAKGDSQKIYWGAGTIQEKMGELSFKVNPESFMQTNTHAAEKMLSILREWADNGWTLIDLYCGSGAIGLSLAGQFAEVIGVELNPAAIQDARESVRLNEIANARFLEGRAEQVAPNLPVGSNAHQTTVVVDPPRAGLHPKMMETLLSWNVPRIFYVSCNPETLARDLKALSERYDILDVQPMDFFPHTDHVETAVRLTIKA